VVGGVSEAFGDAAEKEDAIPGSQGQSHVPKDVTRDFIENTKRGRELRFR
jgi:hypothetical protein